MSIQSEIIDRDAEFIDSVFIKILKDEIEKEISVLKSRISALENRLEDPFG